VLAKDYLRQAWRLEWRIRSKLREIEDLRSLAGLISPSLRPEGHVTHSRNLTSLQDTIVRIQEAEERLNREIDRLMDLKKAIRATLDQLPNEFHRSFLEKRYLCFMDWAEIHKEMHYSSRWVYKAHQKALEEVQDLLDRGIAQPLPDPDRRTDLSTEPDELIMKR
jgi:predicted RNase H-like nuclease (RuvC/YqgF family)